MPQLMPLMWVNSVMMSILILVMLIIMYGYMELGMVKNGKSMNMFLVNYKW